MYKPDDLILPLRVDDPVPIRAALPPELDAHIYAEMIISLLKALFKWTWEASYLCEASRVLPLSGAFMLPRDQIN
jgi:hypothetical protein